MHTDDRSQRDPLRSDELWRHPFEPATEDRDSEATAIALDKNGAALVAGFVRTRKHDVDYLVLKYEGARLAWQYRYNGPGNDVDRARAIAVDRAGNVNVTGDSDDGHGNGRTRHSGLDHATVKLDLQGKPQWVARYNPPGINGENRATTVAVDGAGNVYVTGSSWDHEKGGKPIFAIATVKYWPSGRQLWASRFHPNSHLTYGVSTLVLANGDKSLYVAGEEQDPRKAEGDLVWEARESYNETHHIARAPEPMSAAQVSASF